MNAPRMDPTVSLGNILVVVTMIVGGVIAWTVTRERTIYNQSLIAEVRSDARQLESRVRVLENTISAQTGQLSAIGDSIGELKVDVRRLLEMTP